MAAWGLLIGHPVLNPQGQGGISHIRIFRQFLQCLAFQVSCHVVAAPFCHSYDILARSGPGGFQLPVLCAVACGSLRVFSNSTTEFRFIQIHID
jgi:hypothetical protein